MSNASWTTKIFGTNSVSLAPEMIITRSGRRMFPTVRCSFNNLDLEPGTKYLVMLDIVPCDNKRYRYAYHRSSWLVAGKADPAPPHRLYCHPDAPFSGEQLKKQVISFEKVKVTNNESDNTGQVNNNIIIILSSCSVYGRKTNIYQCIFPPWFKNNHKKNKPKMAYSRYLHKWQDCSVAIWLDIAVILY